MTDAERAALTRLIADKREAASTSKEAARASLLRSGLYNADGSLKAAYRKQSAR